MEILLNCNSLILGRRDRGLLMVLRSSWSSKLEWAHMSSTGLLIRHSNSMKCKGWVLCPQDMSQLVHRSNKGNRWALHSSNSIQLSLVRSSCKWMCSRHNSNIRCWV